jgi:hypothetical protein
VDESYLQAVESLTPDIIERLRTAVEIGKWPNGEKLSDEQRNNAMQALMIWQAKHGPDDDSQPFTINSQGELILGKGKRFKPQDNVPEKLIFKNKP